jgi:hypothetical protein
VKKGVRHCVVLILPPMPPAGEGTVSGGDGGLFG